MPVRVRTYWAVCLLVTLTPALGRTDFASAADPPAQAQQPPQGDPSPLDDENQERDEGRRAPVAVDYVQPLLGAGYLPYGYPGFDTCPCGADGCFHPARYHCDCGTYKKHWLRTWLRAHFCSGSMLEQYPCHCVYPQFGRGYLVSITPSTEEPAQTGEEPDQEDNEQDQEGQPQDEREPNSDETGRGFRLAPPPPLSQLPACRPAVQPAGFQVNR